MSNPTEAKALWEISLGKRVENTELAAAADINIFTTYGRNLIKLIFGQVTTAEATGATTIKLQEETGTQDLCAATTVTGDAIGTMYFLTGEVAVILNGTGNTPIVDIGANLTGFPSSPIIFGRTATANAIQLVQTGTSATLVITWNCFYVPLDADAYIEAA